MDLTLNSLIYTTNIQYIYSLWYETRDDRIGRNLNSWNVWNTR